MPFASGIFANVAGASNAAAGQIVQSAVWNAIHVDYSSALTQLMQQLLSTISNRNICWMNGGFEVWQRGAGSSSSIAVGASITAYTADRWYLTTGANGASVVSAQAGLVDDSQLCARVQKNAAQTGVAITTFGYPLDTDEIFRMRGNIVTLNFLVRAGANWSPANGTLTAALFVGTGAVAKRGGGFTSETTVLTVSTNLTAGGAAVAVSATSSAAVPITATQAEVQFTWTPVGTAGAADYFEVDNLQIENNLSSTTWTPMNYDLITFPDMLQGCKRHFYKNMPYGTAPQAGIGSAGGLITLSQAAERCWIYWQYPVEMRTSPTLTKFGGLTATSSNWITFGAVTVSASIASQSNNKGALIYSSSVAAAGEFLYIHAQADAGI